MEIVHIFLVSTISILCLLFGIRVYFSAPKEKLNKVFFVLTCFITAWVIFDFTLYQVSLTDYQTALNRIGLANISLMCLVLAYFGYIFPKEIFKIPKIIYLLLFLITAILVYLILFTPTVVDHAFMESYGSNFIQGGLFTIFAIYTSVLVLFAVTILIIKYRKFKHETIERSQIKYLFYGIASLGLINLIFSLFIPMVTKNFLYARFATYSAVFFVGFTAYAILKTKLFNLKIIVTESAVVILNVISIVQIFTSNSTIEGLLRALFAVIIFYGSWILVQSVRREIKQKEQLQDLTMQLSQANAHLKELDEMKTEFVSLASHELLTPVSAIEGYLSMMLDEHLAKVEDPTAIRYMDRIYRSSKRLARLISDMLNISRIEEGRLLVEKKDVNLTELIAQVIDEIKFKAEEKQQKVVFQGSGDRLQVSGKESKSLKPETSNLKPDFQTYADPDKIKEVIVNLIGNSIKYSKDPGTITISIKKMPKAAVEDVWSRVENEIKGRPLDDQEAIKSAVDPHFREIVGDEQILISVKDQGIGIPKEELPRLFKKFHRVGDYSTAESQGTGLGLYISRALVELHHGRIWADSEGQGKGSTFTFSLPDIAAKEQVIGLEKEIPQDKEQLKPLAKPMKASIDDKFENFPITDEELKKRNHEK